MRGDSGSMRVLRPRSPEEALSLYGEDPSALPIAGGTDFMVSWNAGQLNGRSVLDLWPLRDWRRIEVENGGVRVGALATHARIQAHPVLRREFPLLVEACATVGAVQIQNRGTLGGNIANASPAADTFPPLAVYEARVRLASSRGRRVLPFLDVFAGVKKTRLEPGELVEAVELPFPRRRPDRAFFRKVGARAAQTISKTMGAGLLWLGRGGAVEELRLSFGSVAPTVRRLRSVESFARGKSPGRALAGEAAVLVEKDISPIDDIRSTARYRLEVTRNLVRRFLS